MQLSNTGTYSRGDVNPRTDYGNMNAVRVPHTNRGPAEPSKERLGLILFL